MPHWDSQGREEWVCQKGAHVCTGKSTWVDGKSDLGKKLGCHGNVCDRCLNPYPKIERQMSLMEYAKLESGLEGAALMAYVNRYYGHG